METFEVKRTKVKATLYGKSYEVEKPSSQRVFDFQDSLAKLKDGQKIKEHINGFLVSLGFDKGVVDTLEVEHLYDLIAFFTGSKKK